jgi:hypothetical protein
VPSICHAVVDATVKPHYPIVGDKNLLASLQRDHVISTSDWIFSGEDAKGLEYDRGRVRTSPCVFWAMTRGEIKLKTQKRAWHTLSRTIFRAQKKLYDIVINSWQKLWEKAV